MSLLNIVFLSIIILLVITIIVMLFLYAFKSKNEETQESKDLKENFHEKLEEKNEIIKHIKEEIEYLKTEKESIEQSYSRTYNEYVEYKNEFVYSEKTHKEKLEKSKTTQKAVLRGSEFENLAPFVVDMPGHRKDLHFLGNPIDYICFEGKYEDTIEKIWFIEIKTNTSVLSKRQKQIKKCIEEGEIGFLEIKINDQEVTIR